MKIHLLLLAALCAVVVVGAPAGCNCDPPKPKPEPTPTAGSAVTVADARVRSCEALLRVDNGALPAVTFGSAVVGETVPKAPRFAIAFRAAADASLVGADIADFAGAAVLERAVCYDAAGNVVDGAPLALGQ